MSNKTKSYILAKGIKPFIHDGEEVSGGDKVKLTERQAAAFNDKLDLTFEARRELLQAHQVPGLRVRQKPEDRGQVAEAPNSNELNAGGEGDNPNPPPLVKPNPADKGSGEGAKTAEKEADTAPSGPPKPPASGPPKP